jgi:hypothetical protein
LFDFLFELVLKAYSFTVTLSRRKSATFKELLVTLFVTPYFDRFAVDAGATSPSQIGR